MRNTTIKNLTLSILALATLTLSAVAEPQAAPPTTSEAPVNAVVETLELRERQQQPLIVQEDVEKDRESQQAERPRGESRTLRDTESRQSEKPLLDVHGF